MVDIKSVNIIQKLYMVDIKFLNYIDRLLSLTSSGSAPSNLVGVLAYVIIYLS